MRVAALFVHPAGPYFGRPDVDPWGEERDARLYAGPWPVVAHPPCGRWATFSTWKTGAGVGQDDGCFESALASVRRWGGVLEHPERSFAWGAFGLPAAVRGSWARAVGDPGWSTIVDQRAYGHKARKRTWLYYVGRTDPPPVDWTREPDRDHGGNPVRVGVEVMSKRERALTPPRFADMLIALARGSC